MVEGFTSNAYDYDDDADDDYYYYRSETETSLHPYGGHLTSFTWHLNEEFKNKNKKTLIIL